MDGVVLFTSNRSLKRAENLRAVYDAYDGAKRFIQVDPYRKNEELSDPKYSLRVTDELISTSPGKAVFIGHSFTGGKLYGLDQPFPYFRRENAKLLTFVVTSSKEMIKLAAKQCGVSEERVLALGLPRTDCYFGAKKGDGGTFMAGFRRSYLYAPTYRTKEETPLPEIDWERIDRALSDDEKLVVKPHMLTSSILRGRRFRHIEEVSPGLPSTPYLMDCDVLITDYSTIMMDAYILQKPVILFEKQPGYLQTRGMYLDYPLEYSSRYAVTEDELLDLMRTAKGQTQAEMRCMEKTAGACDGHSTQRVVDLIRRAAS